MVFGCLKTGDSRPWPGSMRVMRAGNGTIPWKFERTNRFRSLAFIRIRRDSHRKSIQDRCGDDHPRPESESMSYPTGGLWVEPWQGVLNVPGTSTDDPHLAVALWADKRINLVDFPDQSGPILPRPFR